VVRSFRTTQVSGRAELLRVVPPSPEVDETYLQRTDFVQPAVFACFGEALLCVVSHIVEATGLCGVNRQEAAFDAGMLVDA
jgi:hypothetical protein